MALPNNLIQEKQWKDLQISSDDLQALSAFLFERISFTHRRPGARVDFQPPR